MVLLLRLKDIEVAATDSQRQILEVVTELILQKKDLGEYLIDKDQELGGPLKLVRMTNIFANNFGIHDLSSFHNVFRDSELKTELRTGVKEGGIKKDR